MRAAIKSMTVKSFYPLVFILFFVTNVAPALADSLRVAVAANFTAVAKQLAKPFQAQSGHRIHFSFASTGQLYAQITQGAPFDVFLAADQQRPQRLEKSQLAVAGSRFTYAKGKLVLYSNNASLVSGAETLNKAAFHKLAIANPKTAPYGAAALACLRALGVEQRLAPRLVQGNNIAQTYQFVQSENAELGFVALSQVISHQQGSRWIVPQDDYPVIAQDAVLLKSGEGKRAAQDFLRFLRSEPAKALIRQYGYDTD